MSGFQGFSPEDFNVFAIEGLEARMEAIKSRIRPKFEYLGNHFSAYLSVKTGDEMVHHIAKHARRTVNPPDDTWVAWAADKRGYKKHPHFQIGLWGTHLFVWFAVIYEAPFKEAIGKAFEESIDVIWKEVPPHFRWSPDHTLPESTPQAELGRDGLLRMFRRLQQVKKAEILCGITIDRHDPILSQGDKLLSVCEQTFDVLARLYRLCHAGVGSHT